MSTKNLYIGTSGWSYDDWIGDFYPEDLEKRDMLPYYVQHFNTVEINSTYYRMPFRNMVIGWNNKASEGFKFAVKGHRRITHYNKLENVEKDVTDHIDRVKPLKEHLGPFLWQLPPSLEKDNKLLTNFLELLDKRYQHAIEFRNESWLDQETYDLLKEYEVALVWVSSHKMPMKCVSTSDFIYARFHGLEPGYDYDYSERELKPWVAEISEALQEGKEAYIYFNNDKNCRAIKNARELREMLSPDISPRNFFS